MERAAARWSLRDRPYPSRDFHTPGTLLDGWTSDAEMIRSQARRKNVVVIGRAASFGKPDLESVRFDLRSHHNFLSSSQNDHLQKERTQNPG
jgi:hypothetical protein